MDAQKVSEILIKVFFINAAPYFKSMAFLHALLWSCKITLPLDLTVCTKTQISAALWDTVFSFHFQLSKKKGEEGN